MDRLSFIQAVRGFAALSVVLFHSLILLSVNERASLSGLFNLFKHGDIGVDIFFIVSGFVMVLVVDPIEVAYKGSKLWLASFIVRRMWRVMVPYVLFTFVAFSSLWLLNPSKLTDQASLLHSILLIPSERPFVLMVGWSLVYEFYFYIIFGVFCFLFGKLGQYLTGFLCLSIAFLSIILLNKVTAYGNYDLTLPAYFFIGIFFAVFKNTAEEFLMKLAYALGGRKYVLLLLFFCFVLPSLFWIDSIPSSGYRLLDYGPVAIGIFLFFWLLGALYNFKSWIGLVFVGELSYSLYLTHWLVINGLVTFFTKLNLKTQPFHLVLASLLCLLVSYVSWRFFESPVALAGKKFFNMWVRQKTSSSPAQLKL